jgi:hypothetical protein
VESALCPLAGKSKYQQSMFRASRKTWKFARISGSVACSALSLFQGHAPDGKRREFPKPSDPITNNYLFNPYVVSDIFVSGKNMFGYIIEGSNPAQWEF